MRLSSLIVIAGGAMPNSIEQVITRTDEMIMSIARNSSVTLYRHAFLRPVLVRRSGKMLNDELVDGGVRSGGVRG